MVFVHCDIFNWKLSVLRKAREEFQKVKERFQGTGYNKLYTYTQNRKWCKLLDPSFVWLMDFEYMSEKYEVLEWEL